MKARNGDTAARNGEGRFSNSPSPRFPASFLGSSVISVAVVFFFLSLSFFVEPAGGETTSAYLHNLADFTGTLAVSSPRISVDNAHKEVYVISGDLIRVYNANGMEIHSFGEDLNIGVLSDAALDEKGNIYVLSYSFERKDMIVTLCNYRGDPIKEVRLTNIPPSFAGFRISRIFYREGTLYLASESGMAVIMTDADGVFKDAIDLFKIMDIKPEKRSRVKGQRDEALEPPKRETYGISGFTVDHEGNMLFTSPITSQAYIVSPDRKAQAFGKKGGAPGKMSVPQGITRDMAGNYLVSDILRCVVMIFGKDLEFITEFGYRGLAPGNLIGPTNIVVDSESRLYVSELMERGVSVFKLETK